MIEDSVSGGHASDEPGSQDSWEELLVLPADQFGGPPADPTQDVDGGDTGLTFAMPSEGIWGNGEGPTPATERDSGADLQLDDDLWLPPEPDRPVLDDPVIGPAVVPPPVVPTAAVPAAKARRPALAPPPPPAGRWKAPTPSFRAFHVDRRVATIAFVALAALGLVVAVATRNSNDGASPQRIDTAGAQPTSTVATSSTLRTTTSATTPPPSAPTSVAGEAPAPPAPDQSTAPAAGPSPGVPVTAARSGASAPAATTAPAVRANSPAPVPAPSATEAPATTAAPPAPEPEPTTPASPPTTRRPRPTIPETTSVPSSSSSTSTTQPGD